MYTVKSKLNRQGRKPTKQFVNLETRNYIKKTEIGNRV